MTLVSSILKNKEYCFSYLALKKKAIEQRLEGGVREGHEQHWRKEHMKGPEAGVSWGKNQKTSVGGAEGREQSPKG